MQQEVDCPECGEIYKSNVAMKKHYDTNHKWENANAREVCKWWRMGRCNNINCKYAHVGNQQRKSSEFKNTKETKAAEYKNGNRCEWLDKGKCSFFHKGVGIQKPWVNKDRNHEERRQEPMHRPLNREQGLPEGSRQPNQRRQFSSRRRDRSGQSDCRFDGRCERLPNCPYFHSLQNFPLFQGQRQKQRRN